MEGLGRLSFATLMGYWYAAIAQLKDRWKPSHNTLYTIVESQV
ncbi:hypothetical protein [Microcoleus sp. Pol11C3]